MEKIISKTPMITADYFSEQGLIKQVGLTKGWWNQIILKELIDNALDAIEPLKKKEIQKDWGFMIMEAELRKILLRVSMILTIM